ncbi:hypothetical protein EVAR_98528_1 [Eumeta japonica]|uniref:Uncharacterized protein n=1 Tax=Eumeta variegata TaxID=151549 RepID=A0A4C2A1D5_EUMVA|nr:hypothetical protein EVAR_98528_1 [Eumeta japonica]
MICMTFCSYIFVASVLACVPVIVNKLDLKVVSADLQRKTCCNQGTCGKDKEKPNPNREKMLICISMTTALIGIIGISCMPLLLDSIWPGNSKKRR